MTGSQERRCIKCGRGIVGEESICEVCNQAGMATPSATQYHATIVAAIVVAVAGLAIAASLSLRGIGPYAGTVLGFSPEPGGLTVTVQISNQGTRAGRAQCQLVAVAASGSRLQTRAILSPQVDGGGTVVFGDQLPGLAVMPERVTIDCR